MILYDIIYLNNKWDRMGHQVPVAEAFLASVAEATRRLGVVGSAWVSWQQENHEMTKGWLGDLEL